MAFNIHLATGGSHIRATQIYNAIKIFNMWSQIVDDINDNSAERKGVPTTHIEYGLNNAIFVTYHWFVRSEELMCKLGRKDEFNQLLQKMIQGQYFDCEYVPNSFKQYLQIAYLKTVCFAKFSGKISCASHEYFKPILKYTEKIGYAIQIGDDFFDHNQDINEKANNVFKISTPLNIRSYTMRQIESAKVALEPLPETNAKDKLIEIAKYIGRWTDFLMWKDALIFLRG